MIVADLESREQGLLLCMLNSRQYTTYSGWSEVPSTCCGVGGNICDDLLLYSWYLWAVCLLVGKYTAGKDDVIEPGQLGSKVCWCAQYRIVCWLFSGAEH